MPDTAMIIERLNDAVRRDWKAMHNLIATRTACNLDFVQHQTIICVPVQNSNPQIFMVGLLGVINGLFRDADTDNPIEACYDEDGELISFKLRGDNTPARDYRAVALTELQEGQTYRVKDRAGNRWEGAYAGPGDPGGEQGVHLRLTDGSVSRIYFHDVASVIRA